jgi:outer membrane biosynthesis protein TonB
MKTSAAKILYTVILAVVIPAAHADTKARSSYGGSQSLSVNGVACPELVSWSGGDASAKVVVESAASAGATAKKHIGNPAYEPIIVEVALPLSPALQNSLADLCANRTSTLTLLLTNTDGTQLQATNALLTEARFPPLDATMSKDVWRLTLVFRPESTHAVSGGTTAPAGPRGKTTSSSNFRFTLGGLPGTDILGLAGFTVTRAAAAGGVGAERDFMAIPGSTQIPDLSVTIRHTGMTAWTGWRDDFIVQGNASDAQEKSGSLEILGSDIKTVLLTLQLSHVGIKRLARVPGPAESGVDRFQAELYCESISVASSPVAGATTPAATPETPAETAPADTGKTPAKEPAKTPDTPAETAPTDSKAPADAKTPAKEPPKTPEPAPSETGPAPAAAPATNPEAATNPQDKGPRDPADFPRAKDTTRTQYSAVRSKGFVQETVNYTARAKADDIMAFYEQRLKGSGWEETARYENDNGTNRAHQVTTTWTNDIRTVSMTFMDTASGIVEIQVVLQARGK